MKRKGLLIVVMALFLCFGLPELCSLADGVVVAFEEKEYTVFAGRTETIVPVIQGTKQKGKMEYSSSDDSIAVVTNGKVKGLKAGKVTITCTATVENEKFQPSYVLTVLQPVTKIEVPKKTVEMPAGCTSKESVVNILPEDASNQKIEYSSSNKSIARLDKNGNIVTGSQGGTATITVMSTDGSNVKASFKVKVPKSACFFSKSYVIDDPEGIDIIFIPTAGYNYKDVYCSNDNIMKSFVEPDEDDIPADLPYTISEGRLTKVHITPQKPGESKFVFDGFLANKVSISIKVNRSAVYVPLEYDECMKNLTKNTGLRFRVDGVFLREESRDGERVLILTIGDNVNKPLMVILPPDNQKDYTGKRMRANCVLSGSEDFVSETGLTKQMPVFRIESIVW